MIEVLTGILGAMLGVGGYQLVAEVTGGRLVSPRAAGRCRRRWMAPGTNAADLAVVTGLGALELFAAATVVAVLRAPFPVAFDGLAVATLLVGTALVAPAQVRRLERARAGPAPS